MAILVVGIIVFILFYQKKVFTQRSLMQEAENKYQRGLLSATILAEENERERMAKNIHDELGAYLNLVKLNMGRVGKHLSGNDKALELHTQNIAIMDETIQRTRALAKELAPRILKRFGYIKSAQEFCRQLNQAQDAVTVMQCEDEEHRFDEQTEIHLYRITQEILNNILKHADAGHIYLSLGKSNDKYCLQVTHDGQGINDEDVKRFTEKDGMGLKNIQSRAQLINATVNYAKDEKNAYISVILPDGKKN